MFSQGRVTRRQLGGLFAVGVTTVDAVSLGLLFERFLSGARRPADIDIDIESGRREEVIQYVCERYGRDPTAQVANASPTAALGRSHLAHAFGYRGQLDAWSQRVRSENSRHDLATESRGDPPARTDLAALHQSRHPC